MMVLNEYDLCIARIALRRFAATQNKSCERGHYKAAAAENLANRLDRFVAAEINPLPANPPGKE